MKHSSRIASIFLIALCPLLVLAAPAPRNTYIGRLIVSVGGIVKGLFPILGGIALLVFFWGLAKTVLSAGSEKEVAAGKNRMIWGIIALFVMVSVWGIVTLLRVMLGLREDNYTVAPVCYYNTELEQEVCLDQ